ncbi:MAG: hypothetical protein ACO3R9_07840 [Burkholderiaceae bacterium]|jgi:hypothetical protein
MADAWDLIAEMRIQKAIENGDLSNLSGEGRAVAVTEDFSIPWTVRWLLRKTRQSSASSEAKFQAKAIASQILTGEHRRARLTALAKKARGLKAVKSSKSA